MQKLGAVATRSIRKTRRRCQTVSRNSLSFTANLACVVLIGYFNHLHSEIALQKQNKVSHMHSNQEAILHVRGRCIGSLKFKTEIMKTLTERFSISAFLAKHIHIASLFPSKYGVGKPNL